MPRLRLLLAQDHDRSSNVLDLRMTFQRLCLRPEIDSGGRLNQELLGGFGQSVNGYPKRLSPEYALRR
jgi:hypothetical protein